MRCSRSFTGVGALLRQQQHVARWLTFEACEVQCFEIGEVSGRSSKPQTSMPGRVDELP